MAVDAARGEGLRTAGPQITQMDTDGVFDFLATFAILCAFLWEPERMCAKSMAYQSRDRQGAVLQCREEPLPALKNIS